MDKKELEAGIALIMKEQNEKLTEKMTALELAIKEGDSKEALEALEAEQKSYKENVDELQKQLDTISTQLKKATVDKEKETKGEFNTLLAKNFEQISAVSKTNAVKLEIKDMTLGNALTGDQPRIYNNDAVTRPAQMVNVSDLAQSFPIDGGTYTFTRSTLASGTVIAQVEGADKAQLEYDYTMVDANTDFIAGFAVYSRKMRNNLPFLENTLSVDLRRDYFKGENVIFEVILAAQATASSQIIAGQNKIEMLIAEVATLNALDFMPNNIVVTPADYWDILITEKSTGAGYGLPGVVTFENGTLRINGIMVLMATWVPLNKYYVGNWERVRQPITEGFSLEFSEADSDNFRKNNITARVESQTTLTVEQPAALILGDFTAT